MTIDCIYLALIIRLKFNKLGKQKSLILNIIIILIQKRNNNFLYKKITQIVKIKQNYSKVKLIIINAN